MGYISKSNIAHRLNKTEGLIEQALSQLIRMGYIIEYNGNNCNLQCKGCAYANSCNKTPIKTLKITEKGKRLLGEKVS